MTRELDQIQNKANTDWQLDDVDIDQAEETVVEASADVKEYTTMVLKQIDILHGELTVNDRPEEWCVRVP